MTSTPTTTTTATPAPDPFTKARAEWEADRQKLHPAGAPGPGVVSSAVGVVETAALHTVEDVKVELVALGARYHAALARLEDLTVTGVSNPLFAAAKSVISSVTSLAKSL